MIQLYTTPSCTSCRKAKSWLLEHDLEFKERNIMSKPLNARELKEILTLCENGTEDIISTRSKVFAKMDTDLDELSLTELLSILEEYPGLLKRPLIIENQKLQVGFNEDDIHRFIPREVRDIMFRERRKQAFYSNYEEQMEMMKERMLS